MKTLLTHLALFTLSSAASVSALACLNLYHIADADERLLYGLMFKLAGFKHCSTGGGDVNECQAMVFSERAIREGISPQFRQTLNLVSERRVRRCSFRERQQLGFNGNNNQRIACIDYHDKSTANSVALLLDKEQITDQGKYHPIYKIRGLQTISRDPQVDHLDSRMEQLHGKPLFSCTTKHPRYKASFIINDRNDAFFSYDLGDGVKGRCVTDRIKVQDCRKCAGMMLFRVNANITSCDHPELLAKSISPLMFINGYKDSINMNWGQGKYHEAYQCKLNKNFELGRFFKETKATFYIRDGDEDWQ